MSPPGHSLYLVGSFAGLLLLCITYVQQVATLAAYGLSHMPTVTAKASILRHTGTRSPLSTPSTSLFSSPQFDGIDDSAVKATIAALMERLSTSAPQNAGEKELSTSELNSMRRNIETGLTDVLRELNSGTSPTGGTSPGREDIKAMLYVEANLIANEMLASRTRETILAPTVLSQSMPKSSSFSPKLAPIVLVHGPGQVGSHLLAIATSIGKSIPIRLVNADFLGVMNDSELKYALRDCKTVIIAADSVLEEPKSSWFGKIDIPERKYCIDGKSLKRLLNAVMAAEQSASSLSPSSGIRVVCLANAANPPKSAASFLVGDTFDLASDFTLQCKQRSIAHCVVKCGRIIDDAATIPEGVKSRRSNANSPIAVTLSNTVQYNEATRLSVAAEALLRAASLPSSHNISSSFAVLSTDADSESVTGADGLLPTDADWDDALLALDGPELRRIPLVFASERQAVLRAYRVASALSEPDPGSGSGGLVTPVSVERFSNGVRMVFVPKQSSYESKREERSSELQKQEEAEAAKKKPKTSLYIAPELDNDNIEVVENLSEKASQQSGKRQKLEGGIEVIVDRSSSASRLRVRIRRCAMGPETIVKEESEVLIVSRLEKAIQSLEEEYRAARARYLEGTEVR